VGLSAGDGSLDSRAVFGTIPNSRVRFRERRTAAPTPASQASVKLDVNAVLSKPAASAPAKEEPRETKPPAPKDVSFSSTAKKPVPSLKRGGSSGIMQAFAKGASAKPKKKEAPQPATPSAAAGESSMALSDDGEDDSEAVPQAKAPPSKSRQEREEALRRMMDDDDEDEADEKEDAPMEEPEDPAEGAPVAEPEKAEPAEVVAVSAGDGRRRGKRRVMKKKQFLDDEGHLVTMQEPGWESFSEDEVAPAKPSPSPAMTGSQAAKPRKAGPKGSQGSIMSFFSKK